MPRYLPGNYVIENAAAHPVCVFVHKDVHVWGLRLALLVQQLCFIIYIYIYMIRRCGDGSGSYVIAGGFTRIQFCKVDNSWCTFYMKLVVNYKKPC